MLALAPQTLAAFHHDARDIFVYIKRDDRSLVRSGQSVGEFVQRL